uniref:Uncharacterized protein n=1 Tax=Biomphalaria glabrata TaxID=6526 RepID=A0A2C9KJS4_BIOGL
IIHGPDVSCTDGGDGPGRDDGGDGPGRDDGGDGPGRDDGGDGPGRDDGGGSPGRDDGGDCPGRDDGGDGPPSSLPGQSPPSSLPHQTRALALLVSKELTLWHSVNMTKPAKQSYAENSADVLAPCSLHHILVGYFILPPSLKNPPKALEVEDIQIFSCQE